LIFGAFVFGIGWGLGGLCPGPVFVLFPQFTPQITLVFTFFLFSAHVGIKYFDIYLEK
jgi:uncharacterized membrane protein YedE/YeeE